MMVTSVISPRVSLTRPLPSRWSFSVRQGAGYERRRAPRQIARAARRPRPPPASPAARDGRQGGVGPPRTRPREAPPAADERRPQRGERVEREQRALLRRRLRAGGLERVAGAHAVPHLRQQPRVVVPGRDPPADL